MLILKILRVNAVVIVIIHTINTTKPSIITTGHLIVITTAFARMNLMTNTLTINFTPTFIYDYDA